MFAESDQADTKVEQTEEPIVDDSFDYDTPVNSTDSIFPHHSPEWTQKEFIGQMPCARSAHTCTSTNLGKSFVIVGGYGKSDVCSEVYIVDASTYNTISLSALDNPELRVGHACVELYNQLYIFGGWNSREYVDYGCLLSLESKHMLYEDSKSRVVPLPRRDHTLTRSGRQMYLFGGWNTFDQYNDLWVLDRQKSWTWRKVDTHGTPPIPRRGHIATRVGTEIWVFGGVFGYSKYLNDVHVLNTETLTWSQPVIRGEAPSKRAWHSAVALGDSGKIVIFGGSAGRNAFSNELFVLDTSNRSWHQIDLPNAPAARCSHTACLVNGKMVVFGGLGINAVKSTVEPLSDVFELSTGFDLPWVEEAEAEMIEDSSEDEDDVVTDNKASDDQDKQFEGWLACQLDDEEKWERRYFRLLGTELRGYEHKVKGCVSLAGGMCKQWTNKRAESGMEIPDPNDIQGLSTMLTSLLNAEKGSGKQKEFIAFCKTIYSFENVEFYLAAEEYRKKQLASQAALTQQAHFLYQRYIKFGAEYEVHASTKIKQQIKKDIKGKTFDNTLFDKALKAVYNILRTDTLPKYVDSLKQKASLQEGEQFILKNSLNDADMKVESCENCMVKFSFARRRNFCRFCGNIYCGACANQQVTLPPQYGVHTRVRVCDMCSGVLSNRQGHHAFSFHSQKRNRPLNLAVETEHDMIEWMNALTQAADTSCQTPVYKQGWLMKEDPTTKVFRRRYFIVCQRKLYYYELSVAKTMDLQDEGMIGQVSEGSTIKILAKDKDGFLAGQDYKMRFTVMNSSRAFRLASMTSESRASYIDEFKNAAKGIVGKTPPEPEPVAVVAPAAVATTGARGLSFASVPTTTTTAASIAQPAAATAATAAPVVVAPVVVVAAPVKQQPAPEKEVVVAAPAVVSLENTTVQKVVLKKKKKKKKKAKRKSVFMGRDHRSSYLFQQQQQKGQTGLLPSKNLTKLAEDLDADDEVEVDPDAAEFLRVYAVYVTGAHWQVDLDIVTTYKGVLLAEVPAEQASVSYFFHVSDAMHFSMAKLEADPATNIGIHCHFVKGIKKRRYKVSRRKKSFQEGDTALLDDAEDEEEEGLETKTTTGDLSVEEGVDFSSDDSDDGSGVRNLLGGPQQVSHLDEEDDSVPVVPRAEMAVHAAETELQVKKPQSIGYVVEFARQISQQAVSFSNGEDTNTEGVVIVSRQVVERLQTKLRKVVAEDNKHSIRTTRATHVGPDPVVLDVNVSTFLQTDDATTPVAVKLFRITTTIAS